MVKLRKILGSMSFGGGLNEAQSHQMIKDWVKLGYDEIDTAIMYQMGKTEKIMGKLQLCRNSKKVKIACKANPKKGFTSQEVINQVDLSLTNLQVPSCEILYLHLPDHNIPIEDTLKGVDSLYKDGKFKEFGLSNYASWQVADIYHICKSNNYILPTVYQGMYNPLTRDVELELLPVLRRFGMRFYVYNPLAGGMLSGKYDFGLTDEEQPGGRFFSSKKGGEFTNQWLKTYQDRFWQPSYKSGIDHIKMILDQTYDKKVSLIEASMRWLRHHSKLIDDDGVILGFSKPEHFQQNIDACNIDDPLHEDVINAFEQAWDNIKSKCPKYYR